MKKTPDTKKVEVRIWNEIREYAEKKLSKLNEVKEETKPIEMQDTEVSQEAVNIARPDVA